MDGVDKKNTLYFLAILEGNTIIPLTPEESPIFAVEVSREIRWLSKSESVGQFHNTALRDEPSYLSSDTTPVPQGSLLILIGYICGLGHRGHRLTPFRWPHLF